MSNIYDHTQFITTEILICRSITAMRKYLCITIRNWDNKTILSELILVQKEFGKNQIEHLTEQYLHYFNITARRYVIRVI